MRTISVLGINSHKPGAPPSLDPLVSFVPIYSVNPVYSVSMEMT